MGFFSNLFGSGGPDAALVALLERGAVVVDVRTPGEFADGHAADSQNLPLQSISSGVAKLQKLKKPVIVCCRSGARSGQAIQVLAKAGIECTNGGSWQNVAKAQEASAQAGMK